MEWIEPLIAPENEAMVAQVVDEVRGCLWLKKVTHIQNSFGNRPRAEAETWCLRKESSGHQIHICQGEGESMFSKA